MEGISHCREIRILNLNFGSGEERKPNVGEKGEYSVSLFLIFRTGVTAPEEVPEETQSLDGESPPTNTDRVEHSSACCKSR